MNTLTRMAAGLGFALAAPAAAEAHATLVAADPPMNGVAEPSPQKIDLTFSEEVSAKLSSVIVKDAAGKTIQTGMSIDKTGRELLVAMKQPLGAGTYTVDWRVVASDDGHRTTGTYTFLVK